MNKKLTIRQMVFLFLLISITPIMNYVPNFAAYQAGNSGYISALYTCILLIIFAALQVQIIRAHPNMNFYEILGSVFGTIIAKFITLCYGVWAFYFLTMKVNDYSITLQTTLMPSIKEIILVVLLFFIVTYAIMKGVKTVFLFAEFSFQPIAFLLFLIFLFAIPTIPKDNLIPITITDLENNLYSVPDQCAIGGNLMILLFFMGQFASDGRGKKIARKIYLGVVALSIFSFAAIIVTIGINGAYASKNLAYPIFQSVKSISILNTFERFDPLITMIGVISDFTCICVFLFIIIQCFEWVFQLKHMKEYGIILFLISCCYVIVRDDTQYEFISFYRNRLIYINLIFQYVIPVLLGLICWIRNIFTNNRAKEDEIDESTAGIMDMNGTDATVIETPKE